MSRLLLALAMLSATSSPIPLPSAMWEVPGARPFAPHAPNRPNGSRRRGRNASNRYFAALLVVRQRMGEV